jgi:hypothetical protein
VSRRIVRDVFPKAKAEEDWFYGWEVEGGSFEFDVETDGGQVTLQGEVPALTSIAKAVGTALEVPGVRSVVSQLTVKDFPRWGYRGPYYGPPGPHYGAYYGWPGYGFYAYPG